jgi:hypothetical protein
MALGRPCVGFGAAVTAFVLCAVAACGAPSKPSSNVIQAGQVDIQLPPGWKVTRQGVAEPPRSGGGGGAAGDAASATTTIPLAKQDPTSAFFQATGAFMACLKADGVTFVGAPDPSNPSSPANDPNYLKSLETCASQSHIVQALQAFQASQNNLTPKQIDQENQAYLRWRTCMIGRGWTIPEPTPDSKGRLFSISTNGGGPKLTPPSGEDPTTSQDIQQCSTQAQHATSAGPT